MGLTLINNKKALRIVYNANHSDRLDHMSVAYKRIDKPVIQLYRH
ncbi:MAG: hypothetical protein ABNH00_03810 [Dokdonia sp.]